MIPSDAIDLSRSSDFRAAMCHQVTTVSIAACGAIGNRSGLTATATCSLSDSPPMISVCVNRSSRTHDAILDARCFSLNLLADDQMAVADAFAGKIGLIGEARFDCAKRSELETGAPIFDFALASFDCTLEIRHEVATHSIFVEIVNTTIHGSADPERPSVLCPVRARDHWRACPGQDRRLRAQGPLGRGTSSP